MSATRAGARGSAALKRVRRAGSWCFRRLMDVVDAGFVSFSLVETTEIISRDRFGWVEMLEARWPEIRGELDAVLAERAGLLAMQAFSPTQYGITPDPVWKVFLFQAYGERAEENRRRCPLTAGLIDQIPDLEVAFFSILEPGAHLAPHRGFYKGLIRAHLGLKVPAPSEAVRLQVGRAVIHWREGECVLFDDTYRHEAWNETGEVRVVLLLDVLRPFPPLMARFNRWVLGVARRSPPVRAALANHRAWEKAYYGGGAPPPP